MAIGQLIAPSIGPTRKREDFIAHVAGGVATAPEAQWVFVVDNLDTHCSHALVDWVASLRSQGRLATKADCAHFLTRTAHRIRFVYTPKHCSWLNQIELRFGALTRTILRGGPWACNALR